MHEELFPICQRLNEIKEEVQECPDCAPGVFCDMHEEAWYNAVDKIHCYVEEHKKKHETTPLNNLMDSSKTGTPSSEKQDGR